MDPWLSDRYARVEPHPPRASRRREPATWSRAAARDVDRVLVDVERGYRRRRALRRVIVTVLVLVAVVCLVALGVVGLAFLGAATALNG